MKYYLRTACGVILGAIACVQGFGATAHHDSCIQEGWKEEIPQPVYPDKDLVDLYHKTWEIAAGRVRKGPEGLPGSPYMDENCYEDQIWIWDTCFMVLFAKYAPHSFPGEGSMDNLYKPIWDKEKTPLRIHLVDNPPLFAWVEKEYYDFTGNKNRIHEILNRKQYLQKHFDWFANAKAGERFECSPQNIYLNAIGEDGFTWTGGASGMDNTPRGRDAGGYNKILWIDAISQQALSARCMAQLEQSLGNADAAGKWEAIYRKLKDKVNELYWDEQDGFYYDVAIENRQPCRIRTMASYWPLLAGVASPAQAEKMVKYLLDPQEFGGDYPTPTLSRRDTATMKKPTRSLKKSSASSLPLTMASNRTRYGNATAPVPTSRLPNMDAGPGRNFAAGRRWAPFPSSLKTFWASIRFLHYGMKSSGD